MFKLFSRKKKVTPSEHIVKNKTSFLAGMIRNGVAKTQMNNSQLLIFATELPLFEGLSLNYDDPCGLVYKFIQN